jgi:hypothetical protein
MHTDRRLLHALGADLAATSLTGHAARTVGVPVTDLDLFLFAVLVTGIHWFYKH